MNPTITLLISVLMFSTASFSDDENGERLKSAASVFKELMNAPDKIIFQELTSKAHCIVIIPGLKKGAFMVGAKSGKGYLSCRKKDGVGWTAPGAVRMEGGSLGLQIGGEETDLIMLVMNENGAQKLLSSQFIFGAGASVAAGPIGRSANAETDATLSAEILSWSRTHGVFEGISLQGATLRQDVDDNRELYGRTLKNKEIVEKQPPVPAAAKPLIALLNKYSPRKEKD